MTTAVLEKKPEQQKKRSWRWLRIAVPVTIVLILLIGTAIIHAIQQSGPSNKDYLSPISQAPIGSSRLAGDLQAQGVQVTRVTSTYDASLTLWEQPDSTLFVTAPDFTDESHLIDPRWFPAGSRIVLVRPGSGFLGQTQWPVKAKDERWTAAVSAPDCDLFTDTAAVRRQRYTTTAGESCYQGGAVTFDVGSTQLIVVGAADPFRNDRLDENGNRGFATSLLGAHPQVIWLDLHQKDVWPTSDGPVVTDRPAPDPRDNGNQDGQDTQGTDPATGSTGSASGQATPHDGSGSGSPRPTHTSQPNQAKQEAHDLKKAFPPWFWAIVLLLLIAGAALAAAAARRLGAPVAERLPSRVPANETMLGHGRLYQRGGSRGPSLRILKQNARRKLIDHLGLPAAATDEALANATGLPEERFNEVFGSNYTLNNDRDLVAATRQLQKLMDDAMNATPEGEEQ